MTRETDEQRNRRIRREILTDAYTADEQAISWCYYLEREMTVPFQARCIEERTISPLREGEEVPVVGMTDEVVSSREMFVLVEWMDREFGVPLSEPGKDPGEHFEFYRELLLPFAARQLPTPEGVGLSVGLPSFALPT